MAVTALVWNIENFGTRYGNGPNAGLCENIRCGLIANVVHDAGAQVLIIQEMRRQGIAFLATLQVELAIATGHADWHFDWIPAAIPRGGAVPPADVDDLGFTQTANQEGYAVLYRNNWVQQQGQTRSAGQDRLVTAGAPPASYIDLIISGRQIVFQPNDPVITFAGGAAVLGFPASTCPNANIIRNLRRGRIYDSNDVIPILRGTRRPCRVTIVDPNGVMAAPMSVVAYHAPVGQNNSMSPIYGTLLGFASNALAAGDYAYAGDFNVVRAADLTVLRNRANALNYNGQTWNGGAYNNTSVHAAIAGAGAGWHAGAGVLTAPRDIGLGTAANSTNIPGVLGWLGNAANASNAFLINAPNRNFVTNTLFPLRANLFPANAGTVLNAFYGVGAYPAGTDASTGSALIFNLMLSDHLPVRIVQN